MKRYSTILITILILSSIIVLAQANFSTSIHGTRQGKATAYNKENGGMEVLTNIPIENLPCQKCHADNYPDGEAVNPATYTPSCRDCHNQADNFSIAQETCLSCHNRKVSEVQMYPDHINPHTEKGMKCWDCHAKDELHGDDGIHYASMHDVGAIKAKCTNCHTNIPDNTAHQMHATSGKFECQACHIKSIVQCTNCHFESLLEGHIKRAQTKTKDFQLLVKRRGKYTSGTFMTLIYDGKTNVIFAPVSGHLIDPDGKQCSDCHYNMGQQNQAIAEYNETGKISLVTWISDEKKLVNKKGVVPLVADWQNAYNIDFVNYEGDLSSPTSDPDKWVFAKNTIDNAHLFYAEPLTADEMKKLGITREPTAVQEIDAQSFILKGNYPNPANDYTRITFKLKNGAKVNLAIYDLNGNLVKTVANHFMNANEYSMGVSTYDLPNGKYFIKLSTYDFVAVHEMVVLH